ncbi:meiotic DNA integrity checkpoint [Polyrhizophydium stewartii]|uniref:Meiotic DNA integrity checkpoint n=1 Tax=Polyrhizophydium stewartii TaxID=2732419 RepID=A0ABR4N410_9FUNG|nr:hypothetical protein HK105_007196 [Polyrhizophydium stewartii]
MSDTGDIELLLEVETMFETSGWEDGYRDGVKAGMLEGRVFGCERGFLFGVETGFYSGFAELWQAVAMQAPPEAGDATDATDAAGGAGDASASTGVSARAHKQLAQLREAAARFPRENGASVDPQLEMDRLRGRYRTAAAALRVTEPAFRPAKTGLTF